MKKSHRRYEKHYNCCILSGVDVHHIDGNHSNDSPENWKLMLHGLHRRFHALGHIVSAEHRAKISASKLGHKHSEETIAKIIAARLGYVHTAATRMKISIALKGKRNALGHKQSEDHKAKISASHRGKPRSAKSREAINV